MTAPPFDGYPTGESEIVWKGKAFGGVRLIVAAHQDGDLPWNRTGFMKPVQPVSPVYIEL